MDIGKELPPVIVEPIEDPFRREQAPEPAPAQPMPPERAPEKEPVRQ